MSSSAGHVVVVGAGIIGSACAYYLRRCGWTVTLVDQNGFGQGCSHGNCGFICPSHVLPLAQPGAIRAALKALLRRRRPLYIKPRLDPALWSWFYRFARRCNRRDMLEAGQAIHALLSTSRRLYDELLEQEAIECEWQARGLMLVFRSQAGMQHHGETDKLLSESFDLSAKRFDGEALVELEPAVKPGLAGGWLYESDAHLRPDKLLAEWQRVLKSHGVSVQEGCAVESIVQENGRARGVVTGQGTMDADAFVFATGALTPVLGRHLGCRLPIQPGKGYSITMPRPARCPTRPLIFEEHRVAATPMQSGYRLGSTMEFSGYDATLNRRRLELLTDAARHYLHEPYREPVEERWFGWRSMTPDGKPIIDRSPALGNVLIAAGHNMLGMSMAPATGKLVAELLSDQPPHIDPAPYAMSRF